MPSFKEIFPNKRAVLPVVHVETTRQTLENTYIAKKAQADGVFLISMTGASYKELLEIHKKVRQEFPDFWIGVNCLDLHVAFVFEHLSQGVSGVWTDNSGISELMEAQDVAKMVKEEREYSRWKGLYFGGVVFKYQRPVKDVALAARIAKNYMDVVTTSGSATGVAAKIEQIKLMKEAIGDHPLAIASGLTPENVRDYEMADAYLVASSLLKPGTEEFDSKRMEDFVANARG